MIDDYTKQKTLSLIVSILAEDHAFIGEIIKACTEGVQKKCDSLTEISVAHYCVSSALDHYITRRKTKTSLEYVFSLLDKYLNVLKKRGSPTPVDIDKIFSKKEKQKICHLYLDENKWWKK